VARRGLELRLLTPPRPVSACPSGTRSFTATGHLPEAFRGGQLVRGGPVHLQDTEAGPRAAWRRRRRRLPGVEHPPQCGVLCQTPATSPPCRPTRGGEKGERLGLVCVCDA